MTHQESSWSQSPPQKGLCLCWSAFPQTSQESTPQPLHTSLPRLQSLGNMGAKARPVRQRGW